MNILRSLVLLLLLIGSATEATSQLSTSGSSPSPADVVELERTSLFAVRTLRAPRLNVIPPGLSYQQTLVLDYDENEDAQSYFWKVTVEYEVVGCNSAKCNGILEIQNEPEVGLADLTARVQFPNSVEPYDIQINSVTAVTQNGQWSVTSTGIAAEVLPKGVSLRLLSRKQFIHTLDIKNIDNLKVELFDDRIYANWPYSEGSLYYEFEYAFLDEYAKQQAFNIPGVDFIPQLFNESGISITTHLHDYNFTAAFPKGTLYSRVRPWYESSTKSGEVVSGIWSEIESLAVETPYEGKLNWQMTRTFAEEGKSKTVLSYYDEALRNRQTITNLSTDDLSLVGTSHYDLEGRPAVSVLPVPALNDADEGPVGSMQNLHFIPGFNREATLEGDARPFGAWSFGRATNQDCGPGIPLGLSNEPHTSLLSAPSPPPQGGAGFYYSSNNQFDLLHRELIPESKGFPYSQTVYTNDGTGRIRRQGGVGEAFQIGGDHTTEYEYHTASNEQLTYMFGSNILGDAKHYRRHVVQDPNGQRSVSYLDAAGRTIATALQGWFGDDNPLRNLPSANTELTTTLPTIEHLAETGQRVSRLDPSGVLTECIEVTKVVASLPTSQGQLDDINLTYTLDDFTTTGLPPCPDCRYSFAVTITDECNNPVAFKVNGNTMPTGDQGAGIGFYAPNLQPNPGQCPDQSTAWLNTYPDALYGGGSLMNIQLTPEQRGLYTLTARLCEAPITEAELNDLLDTRMSDPLYDFRNLWESQGYPIEGPCDNLDCPVGSTDPLCLEVFADDGPMGNITFTGPYYQAVEASVISDWTREECLQEDVDLMRSTLERIYFVQDSLDQAGSTTRLFNLPRIDPLTAGQPELQAAFGQLDIGEPALVFLLWQLHPNACYLRDARDWTIAGSVDELVISASDRYFHRISYFKEYDDLVVHGQLFDEPFSGNWNFATLEDLVLRDPLHHAPAFASAADFSTRILRTLADLIRDDWQNIPDATDRANVANDCIGLADLSSATPMAVFDFFNDDGCALWNPDASTNNPIQPQPGHFPDPTTTPYNRFIGAYGRARRALLEEIRLADGCTISDVCPVSDEEGPTIEEPLNEAQLVGTAQNADCAFTATFMTDHHFLNVDSYTTCEIDYDDEEYAAARAELYALLYRTCRLGINPGALLLREFFDPNDMQLPLFYAFVGRMCSGPNPLDVNSTEPGGLVYLTTFAYTLGDDCEEDQGCEFWGEYTASLDPTVVADCGPCVGTATVSYLLNGTTFELPIQQIQGDQITTVRVIVPAGATNVCAYLDVECLSLSIDCADVSTRVNLVCFDAPQPYDCIPDDGCTGCVPVSTTTTTPPAPPTSSCERWGVYVSQVDPEIIGECGPCDATIYLSYTRFGIFFSEAIAMFSATEVASVQVDLPPGAENVCLSTILSCSGTSFSCDQLISLVIDEQCFDGSEIIDCEDDTEPEPGDGDQDGGISAEMVYQFEPSELGFTSDGPCEGCNPVVTVTPGPTGTPPPPGSENCFYWGDYTVEVSSIIPPTDNPFCRCAYFAIIEFELNGVPTTYRFGPYVTTNGQIEIRLPDGAENVCAYTSPQCDLERCGDVDNNQQINRICYDGPIRQLECGEEVDCTYCIPVEVPTSGGPGGTPGSTPPVVGATWSPPMTSSQLQFMTNPVVPIGPGSRARIVFDAITHFLSNFNGITGTVNLHNNCQETHEYQFNLDTRTGGLKEVYLDPNGLSNMAFSVQNVDITTSSGCFDYAGRRRKRVSAESTYKATIGGVFANAFGPDFRDCERIWYDMELHSDDPNAPSILDVNDRGPDDLIFWRTFQQQPQCTPNGQSIPARASCGVEPAWTDVNWTLSVSQYAPDPATSSGTAQDFRFNYGTVTVNGYTYDVELVLNSEPDVPGGGCAGINFCVDHNSNNDCPPVSGPACAWPSGATSDCNFWTDDELETPIICNRIMIVNPFNETLYTNTTVTEVNLACDEFIAEQNDSLYNLWLRDTLATLLYGELGPDGRRNCLDRVTQDLTLKLDHKLNNPSAYLEHHYTLYYYDQAGNLAATVPPNGFAPNGEHTSVTTYTYDALGNVRQANTPDGGLTETIYDHAGRPRFTRDARQRELNGNPEGSPYSFTKYDDLGRVVETGELQPTAKPDLTYFEGYQPVYANLDATRRLNTSGINAFPSFFTLQGNGIFADRVRTAYNAIYASPSLAPTVNGLAFRQNNTRGRVTSVHTLDPSGADLPISTYYSYDAHGNVAALAHNTPALGGHDVAAFYTYDLISGNVRELAYNPGEPDGFRHRYRYDADNRLTHAYFSDDAYQQPDDQTGALDYSYGRIDDAGAFDLQARYRYYAHGPLARIELGQDGVQGTDYAYTLQGWIKGTNALAAPLESDPGQDAHVGTAFAHFAQDRAAFGLGYFRGDYEAIGREEKFWAGPNDELLNNIYSASATPSGFNMGPFPVGRSLHNGNVAWMRTGLPGADEVYVKPDDNRDGSLIRAHVSGYAYDQLHRIVGMGTAWEYPDQQFEVSQAATGYAYDPNGNLLALSRLTTNEEPVDLLRYFYENPQHPNRLKIIEEEADNFPAITDVVASDEFVYDGAGNLIHETGDGSTYTWRHDGKLAQSRMRFLRTKSSQTREINYAYDPQGNRLAKRTQIGGEVEFPRTEITVHVRDASGNVLATYRGVENLDSDPSRPQNVYLGEVPLYGSSRIGVRSYGAERRILIQEGKPFYDPARRAATLNVTQADAYREAGLSVYELSNHLGNVQATVSDYRWTREQAVNATPDIDARDVTGRYVAGVRSSKGYYPFGLQLDDKYRNTWTVGEDYRYGFNGKENDVDLSRGDIQDYGFRLYSPAMARFLSTDPLTASYAMLTPYQFASNTPIAAVDLDGLEAENKFERQIAEQVAPQLEISTDEYIKAQTLQASPEVGEAVVQTTLGFVPVVAQAIDVKDTYDAFTTGGTWDRVFALGGWLPFGDLLKGGKRLLNATPGTTHVPTKAPGTSSPSADIDPIASSPSTPSKDVSELTPATSGNSSSNRPDYITTSDGVTVPADPKDAAANFERAGFKEVDTGSDKNRMFEVPKADGNGTFYSRVQEGNNPRQTAYDGDRIVNTQNNGNTRNKQYVTPRGENTPSGSSKAEKRATGHIQLEPNQ